MNRYYRDPLCIIVGGRRVAAESYRNPALLRMLDYWTHRIRLEATEEWTAVTVGDVMLSAGKYHDRINDRLR